MIDWNCHRCHRTVTDKTSLSVTLSPLFLRAPTQVSQTTQTKSYFLWNSEMSK